jgi:hypothetical protein
MTNIGFPERVKELLKTLGLNQSAFSAQIGLSQGVISEFANGAREPSKDFMFRLSKLGVSLDWFITGNGKMFLSLEGITPIEGNIGGSINALWNAGSVGNNNVTVVSPSVAVDEDVREESRMELRNDGVSIFRIPLLTKEQVLHFDPEKEIPDPKAHSGSYPDYTLVPMPRRFQDYSTDLRAMVVFNGLMAPLLAPGDVAVFQATGWLGDGVYVYRVNGDLHIGHIRLVKGQYLITEEAKSEAEVACDTETFGAIGRVRAVVREIG